MKIILWDIETSPLIVPVWSLWNNNIDHSNILEDANILCACWKELGRPAIGELKVDPTKPRNDKELCRQLRKVLVEADVLVHHNGDDFDLKMFNGRLIYHGFDPLPPIKTIDTKKVAKSKFRVASNRLDYLGAYLGLGRKKKTSFKLWLNIMGGNEKALAYMVKYCKQDIRLLEKIYLKFRPFMTNHPNYRLFKGYENACPNCGEANLVKHGLRYNRVTAVQKYRCNSCGAWSSGSTVLKTVIR